MAAPIATILLAAAPYIVAAAAGGTVGAWGAWRAQSVRVSIAQAQATRAEAARDEARAERDRLSEHLAERDRTIAEQLRAQRLVTASVERCAASVASLREQAQRQESAAVALRSQVRRDLEPIREAIARLGPQNPPAGADCAAEFARWRAEGR